MSQELRQRMIEAGVRPVMNAPRTLAALPIALLVTACRGPAVEEGALEPIPNWPIPELVGSRIHTAEIGVPMRGPGYDVTHTFRLKNEGRAPIVITDLRPTTSTIVTSPSLPVPFQVDPGDPVVLEVSARTDGRPEKRARVRVATEDGQTFDLVIEIRSVPPGA